MDEQQRTGPRLPTEAVQWLCGNDGRTVLVHGARLSAITHEVLVGAGHDVAVSRGPLEVADKSVDLLLVDALPADLDTLARALRPGGQVGIISTIRDHRIPWARKLDRALEVQHVAEPAAPLVTSNHFGFVGEETFRHWQSVNHVSLEALVRDELSDDEHRNRKTAAALALYADYGRGNDGMQLPWVTTCFRATVVESFWSTPRAVDEPTVPMMLAQDGPTEAVEPATVPAPGSAAETNVIYPTSGASYDLGGSGQQLPNDDLLLIDFR